MLDMNNMAHRALITFAAQRHINMLAEGGDPFTEGPFDEEDLVCLAFISADIFDVDLLVTSIPTSDRTEAVDGIRYMFAAMWAAGFKAGAEVYRQEL